MSVFIWLGPTSDTWWNAKNSLGRALLDSAAQATPNDAVREAIVVGRHMHLLDLGDMELPLREEVWEVIEQTARRVSSEAPGLPPLWPVESLGHVADLAREIEGRRLNPDRPGPW